MSQKNLIILAAIFGALALVMGIILTKIPGPKPALEMELNSEKPTVEKRDEIVVHIAGAVKKPGVYRIKTGGRLMNLIDLAGGACENSDLNVLNLAKSLEDGEKVLVPFARTAAESPINKGAISQNNRAYALDPAPVNINSATLAELDNLPGIGLGLARNILAAREKNGPFSRLEDLRKVDGIGDKKLEKFKEKICFY